jgi:hypothetical protein
MNITEVLNIYIIKKSQSSCLKIGNCNFLGNAEFKYHVTNALNSLKKQDLDLYNKVIALGGTYYQESNIPFLKLKSRTKNNKTRIYSISKNDLEWKEKGIIPRVLYSYFISISDHAGSIDKLLVWIKKNSYPEILIDHWCKMKALR